MTDALDVAWAIAWITRTSELVTENRQLLIDLDRDIGDGDHGDNLDRGFKAVVAKLNETPPANPAEALKLTGMTLVSTVGGASGPLYGTAYLRGSKEAAETLDGATLVAVLDAFLQGIVHRGKATVGDKTMVDALVPFADRLADETAAGTDLAVAWQRAADDAETAAQATADLKPKVGRARPLAERSLGTPDAGALSFALCVRTAAAVLATQKDHDTAGSKR